MTKFLVTVTFFNFLLLFSTIAIAKDCKNESECLKFAEEGDVKSQFKLAMSYDKAYQKSKKHMPHFQVWAVKWFKKAAKQGHVDSQIMLGSIYYEGVGSTKFKNFIASEKWFKMAAESGHNGAQASLATLYYDGRLGEKDFDKAFKWYMKAAHQGNSGAQNYLGAMYMSGQGVEQSNVIGYTWATLAADQGRKSAEKLKAHLEEKLTPEEKTEAEVLLTEYQKNLIKN